METQDLLNSLEVADARRQGIRYLLGATYVVFFFATQTPILRDDDFGDRLLLLFSVVLLVVLIYRGITPFLNQRAKDWVPAVSFVDWLVAIPLFVAGIVFSVMGLLLALWVSFTALMITGVLWIAAAVAVSEGMRRITR